MTISSTTRKAGPFTGDGLVVVFPFAFKVFTAADLLVVQTAAGVDTTKALTTDYTVALNADQNASPGGSVTMLVSPPVGSTLTLTSQVANTQGTDLTNLGGFFPKTITDALDRATIQIQQLAGNISRVLQLPISSTAGGALPPPVANTLLGWDSLASNIINYAGVASATVSAAMAPVVAAATLALARIALGVTTVGDALFTAASAAAARATLGSGATGDALFTAATAAAAKTTLGVLVAGTAVASTSGTAIDYTGIPSGTKRITMQLAGVSTSGTNFPLIQLGTSGGVETTGYLGAGTLIQNGLSPTVTNFTAAFGLNLGAAANLVHGSIVLTLLNAATNTWACAGNLSLSNGANAALTSGSKSLAGPLDRVRLTTAGGTDTFDAGIVNILYE